MKLLIVEDDVNKYGQLQAYLASANPPATITHCESLQSSLRRIRSETFDLVILDMTLPVYDPSPDEPDNTVEPFGGVEFLRNLRRFEISTPVVVLTQFEHFSTGSSLVTLADLNKRLSSEYGDNYRGTVYYHASIDDWKQKLEDALHATGVWTSGD